jgi:redox-sensitive bicupin YhaK (pirin superfamily)
MLVNGTGRNSMSGPIKHESGGHWGDATPLVSVREGRVARVGGMGIRRVLPTKRRRTVGPWCFVDLMTPDDIDNPPPLEIGPHPHTGLATVTWLFEGSALHSDSLGTEQLIRPGELNLMTSGRGIAHAELGMQEANLGAKAGDVMGAQIWIAQPNGTRHGESAFEHIKDLPRHDLGNGEATVLMGALGEIQSPARTDWEMVGMDVTVAPKVEIPTPSSFEYAVIPLDRTLKVAETIIEPGALGIVPVGQESLRIEVDGGTGRAMVLGGAPFEEPVTMWWNFVARSKDEIADAWRAWQTHDDDRFAPVPSALQRIEAPTPPWLAPN